MQKSYRRRTESITQPTVILHYSLHNCISLPDKIEDKNTNINKITINFTLAHFYLCWCHNKVTVYKKDGNYSDAAGGLPLGGGWGCSGMEGTGIERGVRERASERTMREPPTLPSGERYLGA